MFLRLISHKLTYFSAKYLLNKLSWVDIPVILIPVKKPQINAPFEINPGNYALFKIFSMF